MGVLDSLLGGVTRTVHVIDIDHPNQRFTIRRRVSRRVVAEFASEGELFAAYSPKLKAINRTFPGFRIKGRTYHYMMSPMWDKLDFEVRQRRKR